MKIAESFKKIHMELAAKGSLSLEDVDKDKTVLVIVDIVNGFLKIGNLASERVFNKVEIFEDIIKKMSDFQKIFFVDEHSKDSVEFASFPIHCLKESDESEIISELQKYTDKNAKIIKKNSTNGFHSEDFQKWLADNKEVDNYIIIGDCTDICVMQFAVTLKTYFNEKNWRKRVVILKEGVETFHNEAMNHHGELTNTMALYFMSNSGIEIFNNIIDKKK